MKLREQNGHLDAENRDLRSRLDAARQLLKSPQVAALRADALDALGKLLPQAVRRAQGKNGSPALLRLIVRSLKSL